MREQNEEIAKNQKNKWNEKKKKRERERLALGSCAQPIHNSRHWQLSEISGSATTEDKTAQKRGKNICDWVALRLSQGVVYTIFYLCLPHQ